MNYFVMKTDPLAEVIECHKKLETRNEEEFTEMHNMFNDPFSKSTNKNKKTEVSVHEQLDGIIYGVCVTETGSKVSVNNWTKILEENNSSLKDLIVVYRIKQNAGQIVIQDNQDNQNE